MIIGDIKTGRDFFLVVEAGVNHENDMDIAKRMVEEAASAGADAIKFQTYRAERLAVRDSPAYWDFKMNPVRSQFELFKQYERFGEPEYKELEAHAKRNGIIFMSTPFDLESVDFLDKLMPIFKVSSSDITNTPLLSCIAEKGKPVFLSTGASEIHEVKRAVGVLKDGGVKDITLLHCVLNYPTPYDRANLAMISGLKKEFPDCRVGYSDHTVADPGMLVLSVAAALGARVIEKHYTLDKTKPGNDHFHALDPEGIRTFVENMKYVSNIIGNEEKVSLPGEGLSRKYARRSLVARTDIPAGTTIRKDMLICKRPGTGISPSNIENVIGRKAKKGKRADEIIFDDDIE